MVGHVERSEDWIKRCAQIDVSGCHGRVRPRKSWKESVTDAFVYEISPLLWYMIDLNGRM